MVSRHRRKYTNMQTPWRRGSRTSKEEDITELRRARVVFDYSAYSIALHNIVSKPKVTKWPNHDDVVMTVHAAKSGDYKAYEQLCLWYHKLPLPEDKQRIVYQEVKEGYLSTRRMYQKGGPYQKNFQ
jgi:hypothetical protein